jgi:hypothetical protein
VRGNIVPVVVVMRCVDTKCYDTTLYSIVVVVDTDDNVDLMSPFILSPPGSYSLFFLLTIFKFTATYCYRAFPCVFCLRLFNVVCVCVCLRSSVHVLEYILY